MTQHFYSWEDRFSTDPDWQIENDSIIVTLNGSRQRSVLCCLSGENGFVKKLAVDEKGFSVVGCNKNCVATTVLYGQVKVEYKKEQ